jgi:hypothetical protein
MNIGVAVAIALIAGIAIGVAAIYLVQQRRTQRLKKRFGPEYERVVAETGDRGVAEARLDVRRRRVQKLQIRSLTPQERARFQEDWRELQARFVDDPGTAVNRADHLVGEVMSLEGYPMLEFEKRAEDISVDHPIVTENYREGHRVALKHDHGTASTEDLRKAMIHYRTLFEELVGQSEFVPSERTRI